MEMTLLSQMQVMTQLRVELEMILLRVVPGKTPSVAVELIQRFRVRAMT